MSKTTGAEGRRRWRRAAVAISLGASLLVVNIGPAIGATYTVKAEKNKWRPKFKQIEKNDRIRWRNLDYTDHNIRSYGRNWSYFKELNQGDVVIKRFKKKGTFKYRCTIGDHSTLKNGFCTGMCGKIKVVRPS